MVAMPTALVLIACKTILVGEPDINSKWTGHENRIWATEHSKMICRRHEIPLISITEIKGHKAMAWDQNRCQYAAMMLIPQWDKKQAGSYRGWRVACPTAVKNFGKDGIKGTEDDEVIGWHLPPCGHRDTIVCEMDIGI